MCDFEFVEKSARVAKAMWEARRQFAQSKGIELEEWGDGKIPVANGIYQEAYAAIDAMQKPR
jgi:hypothetical protein